jgi:hypothetical protein
MEEKPVKKPGPSGARLVCVFLLGCLLFSYPLMALFNVPARVFGVPVLFAYLFSAWVLLIALVALLMERGD